MKNTDLEKLDDAGLEDAIGEARQRIRDAEALQAKRQKERESEAIEAAKATLAKAGLTLQDALQRGKSGKRKTAEAGTRYVNPENPQQVYLAGRGRPPAWFKALEKKGQVPEPQA